jgi:hypothetical protein
VCAFCAYLCEVVRVCVCVRMCECVRVRASACVCLFCGSDVPRVFHARALLIHARACDLPVPLQKSSDGARVRRRLAGCGDGERSLPDRVPPWCSMARTTCAAPAARATSSGVRDPCLDRVGMCALAPCRSSSFTILVAIRSLQLRSTASCFVKKNYCYKRQKSKNKKERKIKVLIKGWCAERLVHMMSSNCFSRERMKERNQLNIIPAACAAGRRDRLDRNVERRAPVAVAEVRRGPRAQQNLRDRRVLVLNSDHQRGQVQLRGPRVELALALGAAV